VRLLSWPLVRWLLAALAPAASTGSPIDPRIREVLALLEHEEVDIRRLPDLAAGVHLSPDRLRHFFAERLSIPIHSCRAWARVRRATRLPAPGNSLTEVAHASNLADAAHLSRAFREMFGITLSELIQRQIELH